MSAPAALAIAKVIYPETKRAPLAKVETSAQVKSPYNNSLEAAMVGAMDAVPIVAGIASNLVAFLSIYNFFNRTLTWLGYRACMTKNLTFEVRLNSSNVHPCSPNYMVHTWFCFPNCSSSSPTCCGQLPSPWVCPPKIASRSLSLSA